ncbi:MAG: MATE family efflux transporter, partial [Oscillospiraceae bacterium]|nr:MATE family efflux transporter [Oscillospiraceae bacterium]
MENRNDLTQGSIMGNLTRFFFPILLGLLFFQLYNTIDAIVVGRFVGPDALAAVGGSPAVITNLVIGFFTGLGTGATVVIAQFFGARDDEQLSRAVHTILAFCVLAGLLLSAFGWLSASWTLRLVKTPADIHAASTTYLRIYYLGATSLLLFNIGSGILRAVGDSRWPLVFLAICCLLNIALDLLFVLRYAMGVAGVAWATVISLTVSAVILLFHLGRAKGAWRLELRQLRIHPSSLRRILYLGVPAAVQGAMYSVSNIIIQAAVNSFGTVIVAAWTAISKFDALYWVTSNAMGAA